MSVFFCSQFLPSSFTAIPLSSALALGFAFAFDLARPGSKAHPSNFLKFGVGQGN